MEERWRNYRRSDGLRVKNGLDGWIIRGSGGRVAWDCCAACRQTFATSDAAMTFADFVYPMVETEQDARSDAA